MAVFSRSSILALFALALSAAGVSYAASIEALPRKDYGRLNFSFDSPSPMNVSTNGTTMTLTFGAPLRESPESLSQRMPGYIRSAALSADKKTLTLTTTKVYRTRQFTSGNKVGLDLIGAPDPLPSAASNAPTTESMLTTKMPPSTEDKKTQRLASATEAKNVKTKSATKSVPNKILTMPAKSMKKAEKPIEKAATALAPAGDMLSTKSTTAVSPEVLLPVLTTKSMVTEKNSPEPIKLAPSPAVEAQSVETATEKATPEPPKPAEQTKTSPGELKSLSITAAADKTDMFFEWRERTAATIFERGRDIWLVFSRYANTNAQQLSAKLPKNVVKITQYSDANNTVLRLTTDGTLHAQVVPEKSGFGWRIRLSRNTSAAAQEVSVNVDSLEGIQRLVLGAYDVAPELRFYDPAVGDLLILVPSYEAGRAVSTTKNFPQLSVLSSSQGIAIASRLPHLKLSNSRSGIILSSSDGLAISEHLPVLANKVPTVGKNITAGVMLPYDQWYVPSEEFHNTYIERLETVAAADDATKADALLNLASLFLANGMGQEALGPLSLIRTNYPAYFSEKRLALLSGVANLLANHIDLATVDFSAPELDNLEEAILWRQVTSLYAPAQTSAQVIEDATKASTPHSDSSANAPGVAPTADAAAAIQASKPGFQFHKFSRPYIRFYPPRIRQKLATIAADTYLADGQEEKALAVYDTLMRDKLLDTQKHESEFALGAVAEKKGENDEALEIYTRVAKQSADPRSASRARAAAAKLNYRLGKIKADDAAEEIELARLSWRGDAIERELLQTLISIYTDSKQYDYVLRTQKTLLDAFPNDPSSIAIAGNMGELFRKIYLEGLGDALDPLKSLSLFYEFKDLTPLGEDGDQMIQKLADRLAALDLLDGAAKLLDNQIKFRAKGEARSRIGARLALINLLNKNPQEAINVLQVTNFGNNSAELQTARLQLLADALSKLDKHEEALGVIYNDTTQDGALLRLDILWAMKDWPNIINRAEDILSTRQNLTDPLSLKETEVLLKLALAYTFEGDYSQLRYLRDYYGGLIPDTAYKQIFDYITNDTAPLDTEDFNLLARQISRTEGFLDTFKAKIAAGKLSEAVK